MKRMTLMVSLLFAALSAMAQTPLEIVSRMEEEMNKHETDGLVMTVDVKIPIIGTMHTRTYALGDKMRIDAKMMGVDMITWSDGVTQWEYNGKTDEITISKDDGSSSDGGDAEMFDNIIAGYDVILKKETADAWYITCKKSKTNTDKDAPKTMDLIVAKDTYYPVSLSAKASGVTMTMRDISFGVTEEQVTFDSRKYPRAKIIDKR